VGCGPTERQRLQSGLQTACKNFMVCPRLSAGACADWCFKNGRSWAYPVETANAKLWMADRLSLPHADLLDGQLLSDYIMPFKKTLLPDQTPYQYAQGDQVTWVCARPPPEEITPLGMEGGRECGSEDTCASECDSGRSVLGGDGLRRCEHSPGAPCGPKEECARWCRNGKSGKNGGSDFRRCHPRGPVCGSEKKCTESCPQEQFVEDDDGERRCKLPGGALCDSEEECDRWCVYGIYDRFGGELYCTIPIAG